MIETFAKSDAENVIPITCITPSGLENWLAGQPDAVRNWLATTGFEAKPGSVSLIADDDGKLTRVLYGVSETPGLFDWASAPVSVPSGVYRFEGLEGDDLERAGIAWGLATYRFDRYREATLAPPRLVCPETEENDRVHATVNATYLVRDLVNTPANDLGPDGLAAAARKVAEDFGAVYREVVGEDLLEQNYPAVHAVGRAHDRAPRLIDLTWGEDSAPKVTLVGKGVCFDTGGLDLKPASGMELMKKDMGGAAHVLGMALMVMALGLNVRLRVLIPAVENSVAGNAMRPGDVLQTRKGLTIEVGNTDAEGRVILSDALAEACTETPDLIIDFATLTGAARIALGADLPALFCNDDDLARGLLGSGLVQDDPLWRMPLHGPYRTQINGKVADVSNTGSSRFGGAITAALFLERFVDPGISWAHIDLMAWNPSARPGRPEGGEAMGMRAVFDLLFARYGR